MSKKAKTALIVIGLLVVVAGFNYVIKMDPTQLAERGVGADPHSHGHEHEEEAGPTPEDMMMPIGPEDAPVKVTVLWADPADLEQAFRPMLSSVAASYEGNVRVEFVDPKSDEYQELVEGAASGIRTGLLINGEMIKEVPEADLGMLAFSGSPLMEQWGEKDVRLAVEHELEAAGVAFEPQVEHDHGGPMGAGHTGHDHGAHAGHTH